MYRILCLLVAVMARAFSLQAQCNDPVASFAVAGNDTNICEGESIVCDNQCDTYNTPLTCIAYMVWDWGDGTRDTVYDFDNQPHTYIYSDQDVCNGVIPINGKQYPITIYVIYQNGSDHYNTSPVRVRPKPRAGFIVQDTICESQPTINVQNAACAAQYHSYTLSTVPSGATLGSSTDASPGFPNPGVGVYQISQTVSNDSCGSDAASRQLVVIPSVQPVASANPTQLCTPGVVQLSSAGTLYANEIEWLITGGGGWSFQNGATENTPNPSVLFSQPGNFTIRLRASGCDEETIVVADIVVRASPAAIMNGINGGCPDGANGFTIDPSLSSIQTGGFPQLTFQWSFPGGTPASFSGQNPPPVTYASVGSYTVTCVITGDASDPCGVTTIDRTFSVLPLANASATLNGVPADGCLPFVVTLENTSTNVDTFIWNVLGGPANGWEFAGGTNAHSPEPQIRFLKPGNYTIHLQLPSFINCFLENEWDSPTIVVRGEPQLTIADVDPQCVPAAISFNLETFDNGNDPNTAVAWSFAGGSPAVFSGTAPGTVSFMQPGNTQVIATATNACGSSTDTLLLGLISKEQVTVLMPPDTLCSENQAVQLQANISGAAWSANAPGGLFDPMLAPGGLNTITVTNGATDPGCLTDTTIHIYVVRVNVNLPCIDNFCDTIGTSTFAGFMPAVNVVFDGPGVIDSINGVVSAAAAGFGNHTIVMTHTEPVSGCVFTADCNYQVFQLPESGIAGAPQVGCVNTPIPFQYFESPAGLVFEWRINGGPPVASSPNPDILFNNTGDFTVWLIIDNGNCRDTAYHDIHIVAPLQIVLEVDPDTVCAQVPVNVTVNVSGEDPQWALQVGNYQNIPGFTSGELSFPSGINDTVYQLTVSGYNACPENSASEEVYVYALAVAHLYPDTDTICSGDTISFQQLSTGSPFSLISLDYGNGMADASWPFAPMQYFADTSQVIVDAILTIQNTCNNDADTVSIVVYPVNVQAFNEVNKTTLCVGEPLIVSNRSQPIQASVYYTFGDGTGSSDPDPVKIYDAAGTYEMIHYVWDECGGYDSLLRVITIIDAPPADFSWAPDTICQGALAQFAFTALPDTLGLSFVWVSDTADTLGGARPFLGWLTPGWHQLTLWVTDMTTGCSRPVSKNIHIRANPQPEVAASNTAACGELQTILSVNNVPPGYFYEWTLSNGFTAVDAPLVYTFSETGLWGAAVLVTDPWQCSAEASIDSLWVKPEPESIFDLSSSYGCGAPWILDLFNETQDALGSAWYLNGFYLSNHTDTTLIFGQPGQYLIQLVAENTWGCLDTADYEFIVYSQPVALASGDTTSCERIAMQFNNESLNADTYWWQFGDGAFSSEESPSHTYEVAGNYWVQMVASINGLCPDTFHFDAPVVVQTSPIAGFIARDSVPGRGIISIIDTSIGASSWLYEYGAGQFSEEPNPVIALTSNWDTIIIQTVSNGYCFAKDTLIFYPANFQSLVLPNAFMPGISEDEYAFFIPKGVGLKSFNLEIFDEWGALVWKTDELLDGVPQASWDGKDLSGKPMPAGTYVWKVIAYFENGDRWPGMPVNGRKGGRLSTIGEVMLIR